MTEKTFSMPPSGERMEAISCPICGGGAYGPYWRCEGFSFVRCTGCGHVYQNPQPVFEDLKNRYQDTYFSYELSNEDAFFELMLLGLRDIGFDGIEGSLPPPRSFLDIGCATGKLIHHMKGRAWEVQGVEICAPAAEYGMRNRGVPIFIGSLDQAPFEDGRFDVIHFSHVIEHVPDPRSFLSIVHRLLKPGGNLVVVTPNVEGFQAQLLKQRWRSAIADHVHLFRPRNLERLLRETGFQPLRWQTWGGLARGIAPGFIKNPLDRLAKRFGFGDVMLCHATR